MVEFTYTSILSYLAFLLLTVLIILYIVLRLTTVRKPKFHIHALEKSFFDPGKQKRFPFPSINDPPTLSLSLVVPAYNEEERLPIMLDESFDYLEARAETEADFSYEIIVVDDGSRDRTSKAALEYCKKHGCDRIRVLTLTRNRGKGGAVRLGVLSSRGENVLFADADAATDIRDLDRVEKRLHEITKMDRLQSRHHFGIVVGSRAHLQEDAVAQRSFLRNLLMYVFHFCVYILCVKGIKDTQCGFKLFTREAASRIFHCIHVERWAFDVELLFIAQQLGMPIGEVAVNWKEVDGSKIVPFFSWMQMARDIFFIRMRYSFGLWNYALEATKLD